MPRRTFGRPGPCSGGGVRLAGPASARAARLLALLARGSASAAAALRLAARSAWRSSGVRAAARRRACAARAAALALLGGQLRRPARRRASRPPRRAAAASACSAAAVSAPRPRRRGVVDRALRSSRGLVVSHRLLASVSMPRWRATVRARARSRLAVLQAGGVLQLAGGVLEAQAEQVATRGLRCARASSSSSHVAQLAWRSSRPSSAVTNLVLTGSLWPARRMASRASGSGTPASSNITRPGLTTATQPSGVALAGAHAGLGRLLGEGLVRDRR